ncbi:hypothetical protein AVEN_41334-1 [Araneus ventricosus]|uniref:Uncharacterized protein n=1 Tax=Araneus ventricosus TaxID=182803 RepID=A0A4Y2X6Z0_ARAVE|nr:hypothetical protein AVEN_21-1 [Araneus ventricosus]GBO44969.1 hypothetical protein AVEN_41334-1 [Araneus ventricosus]
MFVIENVRVVVQALLIKPLRWTFRVCPHSADCVVALHAIPILDPHIIQGSDNGNRKPITYLHFDPLWLLCAYFAHALKTIFQRWFCGF